MCIMCTCVCMCMNIYIYIYIHIYIMCIHIYIYFYLFICTHIIHTHTHTHAHMIHDAQISVRTFAQEWRERRVVYGRRRHKVLYYTMLYYTILSYPILYYTISYYTILYYTILYYTILYYKGPAARGAPRGLPGHPRPGGEKTFHGRLSTTYKSCITNASYKYRDEIKQKLPTNIEEQIACRSGMFIVMACGEAVGKVGPSTL